MSKTVYIYIYIYVITLLFNIYVHIQYYYVVLAVTENKCFSKVKQKINFHYKKTKYKK